VLKRRVNLTLTNKQVVKLRELLKYRKAYAFKEFETIPNALFHQVGKLSEPESTHRFC